MVLRYPVVFCCRHIQLSGQIPLKISLVTPAGKRSKNGNKATAVRWAGFLEQSGHSVDYLTGYDGREADAMISLHAWRTADAARAFKEKFPDRPLVVALTGTDINEFQYSHPEPTLHSHQRSRTRWCACTIWRSEKVPKRFRGKLTVIHQSARPLPRPRRPAARHFDVCVIGHMRDVKDPLRAAYAVRKPAGGLQRSGCATTGRPTTAPGPERAERESANNPNFTWMGEVPYWRVRRVYGAASVMVISSVHEGGANVVSEACVAGLPVIGSDIPGNLGLLGEDYPGVFPVRDTKALKDLLLRAEGDPEFLAGLENRRCKAKARLFTPEAERRALAKLMRSL